MRASIGVLGFGLVVASCLRGQVRPPSTITLALSGTRAAAIETREGIHHDRALAALSLRAAWPLLERDAFTLEYIADAVPILLATANRAYQYGTGPCLPPKCPQSNFPEIERYTKYGFGPVRYSAVGFGLAPFGTQLRIPIRSRVALSTAATAGALYFSRPVPDHEAARLNFVAEVGGGIEIGFRDKRAFTVGYRFQHISNAGTAPINVGLDSHLLAIGLVFPR